MPQFDGLGVHMGNLARISRAQTRSLSPENPTGEPGRGGMSTDGPAAHCATGLGQGWKVSPFVVVEPGATVEIANVAGPGAIQSIWCTMAGGKWRHTILRAWWDDHPVSSIECPLGDFFCQGWETYAPVNSLAVCVNPGRAFNCFWEMPFRSRARMTIENIGEEKLILYYQINYVLTDVGPDRAYFHARFRRTNPLPYRDVYTIADGIEGTGHYVGTYMAWGVNNTGWWGEGEIKFYIDDDREFPTICGTGTEDYFCGAFDFDPGLIEKNRPGGSHYADFSTAYAGLPQVIRPDGVYASQQRFGMYRWHIPDPVRFRRGLRVTMQALGWRTSQQRRYLPLQDDIASVAFWYQARPAKTAPPLPDRDYLEVI